MRAWTTTLLFTVALALGVRAAENEVKRIFPVQPGCTLKIDSYRGNVNIVETDAPEIRIKVHIDASAETDAEAARLREGLEMEFSAAENTVVVRARNPRETGVRFTWNEDGKVDLDFEIAVPKRCDLDLRVRSGALVVGELTGRMNAEVETGKIFFRRIEGSVTARIGQGEIILSRCSGDVSAVARQGLIRLGTIGGALHAKNSSGEVEVMTARGAVSIDAEAGDVAVGFARPVAANARVSVSGGSIRAQIDPAADCVLDAASTFGRVTSKLSLNVEEGELGSRRLRGRLNHGGPRIELRASGGHVALTPHVVDMDRPREMEDYGEGEAGRSLRRKTK